MSCRRENDIGKQENFMYKFHHNYLKLYSKSKHFTYEAIKILITVKKVVMKTVYS